MPPSAAPAATLARRLEQIFDTLCRGAAGLAALAAAAIVVLIGASVAMRHLALAPLRYTEELVGLLVTAAFFLALPLVTLRSDHVRVTLLVDLLPARARRALALLAGLAGAGFCIWFVQLGLPWLEFAIRREIKSEVARLLLYPWMALVPLSLTLTGLAFVIRALRPLGDGPSGDPP